MDTRKFFQQHKDDVVRLWTEAVFATFPTETAGFLRASGDPFANPVAHMTREAANTLFDAVAGENTEMDIVRAALDRFVKLRAVQESAPSRGLGIFFLMKPIFRERLVPALSDDAALRAYLEAESRLDSLTLLAFDMYTDNREALARIRIKEMRDQCAQLRRWAQGRNFRPEGAAPADKETAALSPELG